MMQCEALLVSSEHANPVRIGIAFDVRYVKQIWIDLIIYVRFQVKLLKRSTKPPLKVAPGRIAAPQPALARN